MSASTRFVNSSLFHAALQVLLLSFVPEFSSFVGRVLDESCATEHRHNQLLVVQNDLVSGDKSVLFFGFSTVNFVAVFCWAFFCVVFCVHSSFAFMSNILGTECFISDQRWIA